MGRRTVLKSTLGLAAALALGACQSREPLLRVGLNAWPGYFPLRLAQDLGQLDPLAVRLIDMSSATDCLRALAAGTLEAAGLTLDEVIQARADGIDLTAVLVLDVSNGADALMARPGITSLAGLAGQRVGVEETAVGALMLDAALQAAGLTATQVQRVFLTYDQHVEAFRRREVDAVVSFEPALTELAKLGAQPLYDSRQVPGRVVDVLAVRKEARGRSPQALRAAALAHFAGCAHLRDHPADALARYRARWMPGIDQPVLAVQAGFGGLILPDLAANREWLLGTGARLPLLAKELHGLMRTQQLLASDVSLDGLHDARFLPALST